MSDEEIYARLTSIFREAFDDDAFELSPELSAADVVGWDSIRHIEILIAIQEAWAFKFTSREIDKLAKVSDLVDVVRRRA
jgi:acyl carrier protein